MPPGSSVTAADPGNQPGGSGSGPSMTGGAACTSTAITAHGEVLMLHEKVIDEPGEAASAPAPLPVAWPPPAAKLLTHRLLWFVELTTSPHATNPAIMLPGVFEVTATLAVVPLTELWLVNGAPTWTAPLYAIDPHSMSAAAAQVTTMVCAPAPTPARYHAWAMPVVPVPDWTCPREIAETPPMVQVTVAPTATPSMLAPTTTSVEAATVVCVYDRGLVPPDPAEDGPTESKATMQAHRPPGGVRRAGLPQQLAGQLVADDVGQ